MGKCAVQDKNRNTIPARPALRAIFTLRIWVAPNLEVLAVAKGAACPLLRICEVLVTIFERKPYRFPPKTLTNIKEPFLYAGLTFNDSDAAKATRSSIGKSTIVTPSQGPEKQRRDKPSTGFALVPTLSKYAQTPCFWILDHVNPTTWSPNAENEEPLMSEASAAELSMKCSHRQLRSRPGKAFKSRSGPKASTRKISSKGDDP